MNSVFEDIYGENEGCKKTKVTFRILSDELEPSEVSNSLQIQPTRAYAKEEEYNSKSGQTLRRPIGHWSISSDRFVDSKSTEAHARYLLNILEPCFGSIVKYLNDSHYRTSIVFWWEATDEHGGFSLSSNTLSRLCRLCNDIDYTFIG